MSLKKSLWVALILVAALAANANALVVVDVDNADANTVTGVGTAGTTATITEDYAESTIVPYNFLDKELNALVNPGGGFFDLSISFDAADLAAGSVWTFDFTVTNSSPQRWMAYGFEFWDSAFTTRYADFPVTGWSNDVTFLDSSLDSPDGVNDSALYFWAPTHAADHHEIGAAQTYTLTIDLSAINGGEPGSFGIRQVALVPEPAGLGLLGLAMLGLKRRRG